ncbi:hypothetical protein LB505_004784 [Fusarium chuoi]|nr:hypothetical protein LB505_004784 [Fusarium chuoi]
MVSQARSSEIESVELGVTGIDTDPETHAHTLDDYSISTETSESFSNESGKPLICFDESGDLYLKGGLCSSIPEPSAASLPDSRRSFLLTRKTPKMAATGLSSYRMTILSLLLSL